MVLRFRVAVPKQGRAPDRFVWEIATSAVLHLAGRSESARAWGLSEIHPSAPPNTHLAAAPPRRRPTSPPPPPPTVHASPPAYPMLERNPAAAGDLAAVRLPHRDYARQSSLAGKGCNQSLSCR